MTVKEIKNTYSMKEIISRYGVKIDRKNFCRCPFHNEKTPSFQIKPKSFVCHGCGEHGDIFDFVMKMDNLSWKEAFLSLGGTCENTETDFFAKKRLEKAKMEREKRVKSEIRQLRLKLELSNLISISRGYLVKLEPLSDAWCQCQNDLFYLLYAWEEKYVKGEEVDIGGVIMRHSEFKRIGDSVR